MASRLLFRHRYLLPSFRLRICPATTTTVACATSLLAAPLIVHRAYTFNKPMLLDSFSTSQSPLQREPKTPLINDGRWNGKALKQVSAGSILGLVGGVVVSFFSKPLALVIGLLVVAVQVRYGFRLAMLHSDGRPGANMCVCS
jgi:hypothetical protein